MTLHGFELLREQEIPELDTRAQLWRHIQTGAELLSFPNADENKCFLAAFRTPVADSTGVAHILEHAVLCGSRKYPLKDPFAELIKGSLNTFLNAFTYPDKTCYPVASTNLRDFYNLVDVYLDTVFHPRLAPETFAQQGWHYELNAPDDPLIYKGVVFNEMKGAYSSPESVLYRSTQQSLFPDISYGNDSGGDPKVIPDLTYEHLKGFHQAYYHPSNARLAFWGDDPPEERLRLLDEFLRGCERRPVESAVPLQPRFDAPRAVERTYAAGPDADISRKTYVTVNWMLTEVTEPETPIALEALEHILVGTPASPLRKALIDSGLGEDVTGAGLMSSLRQTGFSTGLKGVRAEDVPAVESLILETLQRLADDGIARPTVEASLNTLEFAKRERNTHGFPRGLSAVLDSLTTWLYDGDPLLPLAFEAPLAVVKERALSEPYFEGLIRRWLLDNPHRTTLTLRPDPEKNARDESAERTRLDETRATLGPDDLHRIIEETQALKARQETPNSPEALATLPTLRREDLNPEITTIPLDLANWDGTRVAYHDLPTAGILYLDIGLDLHALPADLLPYVPLFGRALLQMGTEREDFVTLTQRIGRQTGGLWPQTVTAAVRRRPEAAAYLFVRGKALVRQAGDLLDILRDVLCTTRWDQRERFRQIVLEEKARREASLIPGGTAYVSRRLQAPLHEAGWATEQMEGITSLAFLRSLVERIDGDWRSVRDTLREVQRRLISRRAVICNATLDGENWTSFAPQVRAFLDSLPDGAGTPEVWARSAQTHNEGLTLPAQVNYVGKAANLYDLGLTENGSAAVISRYISTSWLWQQVRVQGGAYGGFCGFDPPTGLFTYLSYRDPNLLGTLGAYDRTGEFLRGLTLDDRELTRGIIGAISDLDRYQLPDAKGFTSLTRWLTGITDEWRRQWRAQVLATTTADFRAFGDVLDRMRDSGWVVVLGSAEAITAANAEHPGLLTVSQVL